MKITVQTLAAGVVFADPAVSGFVGIAKDAMKFSSSQLVLPVAVAVVVGFSAAHLVVAVCR